MGVGGAAGFAAAGFGAAAGVAVEGEPRGGGDAEGGGVPFVEGAAVTAAVNGLPVLAVTANVEVEVTVPGGFEGAQPCF